MKLLLIILCCIFATLLMVAMVYIMHLWKVIQDLQADNDELEQIAFDEAFGDDEHELFT